MGRIADKHGLTNKYRSIGTGKRVVRQGRPRKYLFGAPSRKRKTNRTSNVNIGETTPDAMIVGYIIVAMILLIIPVLRCCVPLAVGACLFYVVEVIFKESWGLPTGKMSAPVSAGWTALTAFAMMLSFIFILLVQSGELSPAVLFITAIAYGIVSFLILKRKYDNIKSSINNISKKGGATKQAKNVFSDGDKETDAVEHAHSVERCLRKMQSTFVPDEFFQAYKDSLFHQQQVVSYWRLQGGDDDSEELLESLVEEKEDYINEFIEKCYDEGVLLRVKNDILEHSNELAKANLQLLNCLLENEVDNDDEE